MVLNPTNMRPINRAGHLGAAIMQSYRPEIDGLRTIAVVAVILFHAGYSSLSGGFLGVDIFFVISGFLITGIIVAEKTEKGTFDFFRFYMRRVRRLIPTLLSVIAGSLVAGMFIFPPDLQADLGGSAIHALLSISNIYFWTNSGYFDNASSLRPLLHTWSLAVEEQFYIIWPATIVVCLSTPWIRKRGTLLVLALFGLFSYFAGELILNGWAPKYLTFLLREPLNTTFYLTPFRVFEFAIGAAVVWLPRSSKHRPLQQEFIALLGIGLMIFAIFTTSQESDFPSYKALIPCLGAALLIWAQQGKWVNSVLGSPPMAYIGRISYTLYLVHWPVIVFYKYWKAGALSETDRLSILAATFLLSVAIYHLFENPLRRPTAKRTTLSRSAFGLACCTGSLLLMYPSALLYQGSRTQLAIGALETTETNDLNRSASITEIDTDWTPLDANVINADAIKQLFPYVCMWAEQMRPSHTANNEWVCNLEAPLQILTIGNSHERAAYTFFRNAFNSEVIAGEMNVTYGATHAQGKTSQGRPIGCNFNQLDTLPFRSAEPNCQKLAERLSDKKSVVESYDVLVVGVLRPLDYGKIYLDYVSELQKLNPKLKVVVMGSLVELGDYRCIDLINQKKDPRACSDNNLTSYYNLNEEREIRTQWPQLEFLYIDQRKLLCGSGDFAGCDIYNQDKPIFFDGSHFNWLATPKIIDLADRAGVLAQVRAYLQ
jgi:peptidoglycan/LPS O-acetylase OafA/YrhL